jgi:hypothetical protein
MSNVTVIEASAGTAAGTDLMANNFYQLDGRARVVSRIGLSGSTAAAPGFVDLFYGSEKIGTFITTSSGAVAAPLDSKDMMPVRSNRALLPNEPLRVLVNTISTTNKMTLTLEIQEL